MFAQQINLRDIEMSMKKMMTFVSVVLSPLSSMAALAPEYQNERDFEVLINFVKSHEEVLATLRSIDFDNFTVHFGNNCEALFARGVTLRPPGWVGPAAPLELKSSTCSPGERRAE